MRRRFPLTPRDRLLAVTTVSFDIAGLELYLPLTSGAAVVLAGKETVAQPSAVRETVRRHRVTAVQATPAFWQILLMEEPDGAAACGSWSAGRHCRPSSPRPWPGRPPR